jgi:hypothetical protein
MADSRSASQVTSQQDIQEKIAAYILDQISARAYELWMERGCPIGSPEVDWFQAEAEITPSGSSRFAA